MINDFSDILPKDKVRYDSVQGFQIDFILCGNFYQSVLSGIGYECHIFAIPWYDKKSNELVYVQDPILLFH